MGSLVVLDPNDSPKKISSIFGTGCHKVCTCLLNGAIRKTYIEPRRDLTLSDISNLQFITWRSRRTQHCFLSDDCKCNRCKITQLPKIIIVDEYNEIISVQNCDKRN